jgi:hypothetical protein
MDCAVAGIACELRVKRCSVDSCVFVIVLAGNEGRNSFFQRLINNGLGVGTRWQTGEDLILPRPMRVQFPDAGESSAFVCHTYRSPNDHGRVGKQSCWLGEKATPGRHRLGRQRHSGISPLCSLVEFGFTRGITTLAWDQEIERWLQNHVLERGARLSEHEPWSFPASKPL